MTSRVEGQAGCRSRDSEAGERWKVIFSFGLLLVVALRVRVCPNIRTDAKAVFKVLMK